MPSCIDKITFVQDIAARVINVSLSTEGACTSPEYNLSAASHMASLTGTFVYSNITSNEMITSSDSKVILFKLSIVFCVELFIFDSGTTDNHYVAFWAIL